MPKAKPVTVSHPTRFAIWRAGEGSWCIRLPSGITRYNLTKAQVIGFLEAEMENVERRR